MLIALAQVVFVSRCGFRSTIPVLARLSKFGFKIVSATGFDSEIPEGKETTPIPTLA